MGNCVQGVNYVIHLTPNRTKLVLRLRQLLTAVLVQENSERQEHLRWPEEAITSKVTEAMREISQWPNSKMRRAIRTMQ